VTPADGLASPFEALARDYDARFTHAAVGARMRAAVWRHLDAAFGPGDRVLDLGCGTGEDACHLAARGVRVDGFDAAEAMVAFARAKAAAAGVADLVAFDRLSLEAFAGCALPASVATKDRHTGAFAGAYSNFGALNCVADPGAVARAVARLLGPGAPFVVSVMGRYVPWEWAWFLSRGDRRQAGRRLHRQGAEWRGLTIRYPTRRELRRAFAPDFRLSHAYAIGALLPPPFTTSWSDRHPRLVERLDRLERRLEGRWPLPALADHVLLVFTRTDACEPTTG
jgi:SAM-dependent methyltransferase